jgi:hypothetical protein
LTKKRFENENRWIWDEEGSGGQCGLKGVGCERLNESTREGKRERERVEEQAPRIQVENENRRTKEGLRLRTGTNRK